MTDDQLWPGESLAAGMTVAVRLSDCMVDHDDFV
jgi:hypothetical protein